MPPVKVYPAKFADGYKPANQLFLATKDNRGTYMGSAMQGYLAKEARINNIVGMLSQL